MIKRLINYINKESELKQLRRDTNKNLQLLVQLAEAVVLNRKAMEETIKAIEAREQMLTTAVLELQEKGVIYAN